MGVALAFSSLPGALATFFMVPILLFEQQGLGASVKRSGGLFKQTWGETVLGHGGLGLAGMVCGLAAVAVGLLVLFLLSPLGLAGIATGVAAVATAPRSATRGCAPWRSTRYPSAASCAYASTAIRRDTPSWRARSRVDGIRAPPCSSPERIARRSWSSICAPSVPSPSRETESSSSTGALGSNWSRIPAMNWIFSRDQ